MGPGMRFPLLLACGFRFFSKAQVKEKRDVSSMKRVMSFFCYRKAGAYHNSSYSELYLECVCVPERSIGGADSMDLR